MGCRTVPPRQRGAWRPEAALACRDRFGPFDRQLGSQRIRARTGHADRWRARSSSTATCVRRRRRHRSLRCEPSSAARRVVALSPVDAGHPHGGLRFRSPDAGASSPRLHAPEQVRPLVASASTPGSARLRGEHGSGSVVVTVGSAKRRCGALCRDNDPEGSSPRTWKLAWVAMNNKRMRCPSHPRRCARDSVNPQVVASLTLDPSSVVGPVQCSTGIRVPVEPGDASTGIRTSRIPS